MIKFVTGFSGSGKSYYIKDEIKRLVSEIDKKIMLIVPEQFSFESERELYRLLGAKNARKATVLSFTRLANLIFRTYGGIAGKTAQSTEKIVFMDLAVQELQDSFEFFKKASKYKSFVSTMLQTVEEFKNAGIETEKIMAVTDKIGDKTLDEKTREICNLYNVYNAILEIGCVDPLDNILKATKKVEGTDFFKGYTVFFDEFKSFTGNQIKLIKEIIKGSNECVFSLCMDDRDELFSSVRDTYEKLKQLAREQGVSVKKPIHLTENKRFNNSELAFVEQNIFSFTPKRFSEDSENVRFAVATTAYEETDYAVSTLVSLVREKGYRYRDFAIIPTDSAVYDGMLRSTLDNYNVPFYCDSLEGINNSPIIRFVIELLNLSFGGYNMDSVLALLKCGFTPFSLDDIANFENYCFVWNIKGSMLRKPFTANPNGFSDKFGEEETAALECYNKIRLYVINAIEKIKTAANKTAREIGATLFELLSELEFNVKIQEMVQNDDTDSINSERLARVWEILLGILDSIAVSAGNYNFTLSHYYEIFIKACEAFDMGLVPQTLDAVTIGSPDRIRMDNAKVVFVLGAQKGVFPLIPQKSGVFNEIEQKNLEKNGIVIARSFEYRLAEQKFNAYKVMTMPSDMLFVVASTNDKKGEPLVLSEIFHTAEKVFGKDVIVNVSELPPEYFCKNPKTSFLTLSKFFRQNTVQTASISEYLESTKEEYVNKINMLRNASNQSKAKLNEQSKIYSVFSKNIFLSPSSVERFYKCKFQFFCNNGLHITSKRRADLDPMSTGTLIHYAVEQLTFDEDFPKYDKKKVEVKVGDVLDEYLNNVMSGEEYKTAQFKYLFDRLKKTIVDIALHLQTEMQSSKFLPADLEFKISYDSEVTPLEITLEDDSRVSIGGRVDRVDIADINGVRYVRVIDYKSGVKTFILNDVLYGQNLQMLIYLFCIWKNGKGKYSGVVPSGVLYMPTKGASSELDRYSDKAESEKLKQYKMNGLLLNRIDSLKGMEEDLDGLFIPVKIKKDGSLKSDSLVSMEELGKLYSHTEILLKQMVTELHKGNVQAVPLSDTDENKTCKYCDYRSVCGVEEDDENKVMDKIPQVFEFIDKEIENDECR